MFQAFAGGGLVHVTRVEGPRRPGGRRGGGGATRFARPRPVPVRVSGVSRDVGKGVGTRSGAIRNILVIKNYPDAYPRVCTRARPRQLYCTIATWCDLP